MKTILGSQKEMFDILPSITTVVVKVQQKLNLLISLREIFFKRNNKHFCIFFIEQKNMFFTIQTTACF